MRTRTRASRVPWAVGIARRAARVLLCVRLHCCSATKRRATRRVVLYHVHGGSARTPRKKAPAAGATRSARQSCGGCGAQGKAPAQAKQALSSQYAGCPGSKGPYAETGRVGRSQARRCARVQRRAQCPIHAARPGDRRAGRRNNCGDPGLLKSPGREDVSNDGAPCMDTAPRLLVRHGRRQASAQGYVRKQVRRQVQHSDDRRRAHVCRASGSNARARQARAGRSSLSKRRQRGPRRARRQQ